MSTLAGIVFGVLALIRIAPMRLMAIGCWVSCTFNHAETGMECGAHAKGGLLARPQTRSRQATPDALACSYHPRRYTGYDHREVLTRIKLERVPTGTIARKCNSRQATRVQRRSRERIPTCAGRLSGSVLPSTIFSVAY